MVGRAMLRLYEPTAGRVVIDGDDVATLTPEALRKKRPTMQMVFQDPQASLNPRMTLADIVSEPLDEHTSWSRDQKLERVYELMDQVGLNRRFVNRFPHEFSGGQRQRIGIARALAASSSATNPSPPWTSRSRLRSSISWRIYRKSWG
jgi:oligopeptide transport system ATP-binding protein